MKVTVLGRVLEVEELAVVRLLATAVGIVDVDVETFVDKVTIKFDGGSVTGKNLSGACDAFFARHGLT